MNPTRFNRKITVQTPINNRTASGDVSLGWVTLFRTYAEVKPMFAKERLIAGGERAVKEYTVTMRYTSQIDHTCRIVFDDINFRITGLAEIGRHEGQQISVQAIE